MTEFPYINSLLPDSAYKKEEVEKPPLCDSLGVFVILQENLVFFYQNTLLIAM